MFLLLRKTRAFFCVSTFRPLFILPQSLTANFEADRWKRGSEKKGGRKKGQNKGRRPPPFLWPCPSKDQEGPGVKSEENITLKAVTSSPAWRIVALFPRFISFHPFFFPLVLSWKCSPRVSSRASTILSNNEKRREFPPENKPPRAWRPHLVHPHICHAVAASRNQLLIFN